MKEEWKEVKDFPNYLVSNIGNVFSKRLNRNMVLCRNSNNYLKIKLCNKGLQKDAYIHRLVASEFINYIPNGMEINHKDGNKHNNAVDNLEIVTSIENIRHAIITGLSHQKKTILNDEQILSVYHSKIDSYILAKELGVTFATIRRIKNKDLKHYKEVLFNLPSKKNYTHSRKTIRYTRT